MVQVFQSPLLQALGYAILNSLWQFGFLWLIFLIINSVISLSPHKKYAAAVALQLSGFAWFCGTLVYYYQHCVQLYSNSGTMYQVLTSANQLAANGPIENAVLLTMMRTEQFLPYLSVAYLLLLVLLSIRWINAYRYTRSLKISTTVRVDYNYRLFVEKICHQLGIKRLVRLYASPIVHSPLTIGYFKPIILVPLASLNHLTQEQMEAVLLHELAHIKRADYLINILLSLLEVALFFNPFMQLLSKHVKRERENSCDDWVLQYEYNPSTYARALVQLATYDCKLPTFAMKAVDKNQDLLMRVKRMIEKKDRTFNYRNQLVALLLLSVAFSSVAWMTRPGNFPVAVSAGTQKVVVEPLVASIENPLFNPVFFLVNEEKNSLEAEVITPAQKVRLENLVATKVENEKRIPKQGKAAMPEILPELPADYYTAALDVNDQQANNLLKWRVDSFLINNNVVQYQKISDESLQVLNELKKQGIVLGRANTIRLEVEKDKVKKEIGKAMTELRRVVVTSGKSNDALIKLAEKVAKQSDEAKRYYEVLFNKEEMQLMNEGIQKQLEKVNFEIDASKLYEGTHFRSVEPATIIYQAPNVQSHHTYSFDYVERPAPARVATATTPGERKAKATSTPSGAEACSSTKPQLADPAEAPKPIQLPPTKRVLKIVRI